MFVFLCKLDVGNPTMVDVVNQCRQDDSKKSHRIRVDSVRVGMKMRGEVLFLQFLANLLFKSLDP
jgi:hypothetical protein